MAFVNVPAPMLWPGAFIGTLINHEQTSFVKGRFASDTVLTATFALQTLNFLFFPPPWSVYQLQCLGKDFNLHYKVLQSVKFSSLPSGMNTILANVEPLRAGLLKSLYVD